MSETETVVKVRRPRLLPAHTGQSGPFIDLTGVRLNSKEEAVLKALREDLSPLSLLALAMIAFPGEDIKVANSWVRNSLRRLVRGRWVARIGEGTYTVTPEGRAGHKVEAAPIEHAPTVLVAQAAQ